MATIRSDLCYLPPSEINNHIFSHSNNNDSNVFSLSPQERRFYQNKLFNILIQLKNDHNDSLYSKQRIHHIVNTIESSSYKLSQSKKEYLQNLKKKISMFKSKILLHLESDHFKSNTLIQSQDINLDISNSNNHNDNSNSENMLISAKLQSLQKHLDPLLLLISKCEQQLSSSSISNEKRNYFRECLSKLELIRSVLEGKDFIVPNGSTQLDILSKIETQLNSLVQRIDNRIHCEKEEKKEQQEIQCLNSSKTCLDLFCAKLKLCEFKQIFKENYIHTVDDIRLLSDNDMKELQLPLGVRNRIKSYFSKISDTLNNNFITNTNTNDNTLRNIFCEQMWDHFKCPITQDLMKDPVVASDGYTYEREAIIKWFSVSDKSPLTGLNLSDKIIHTNHNLKSQITQFCEIINNNNSV